MRPIAARSATSKARRRGRGGLFRLLLIAFAVVLSFASGTPQMVASVVPRLIYPHGAECVIARVRDGDSVLLHCLKEGFLSVDLAGFDAPDLLEAQCLEDLGLAFRARWTLQTGLWNAKQVEVVPMPRPDKVQVLIDGRDVTWRMVKHRDAVRVGGLSAVGRGTPQRFASRCRRAQPG